MGEIHLHQRRGDAPESLLVREREGTVHVQRRRIHLRPIDAPLPFLRGEIGLERHARREDDEGSRLKAHFGDSPAVTLPLLGDDPLLFHPLRERQEQIGAGQRLFPAPRAADARHHLPIEIGPSLNEVFHQYKRNKEEHGDERYHRIPDEQGIMPHSGRAEGYGRRRRGGRLAHRRLLRAGIGA